MTESEWHERLREAHHHGERLVDLAIIDAWIRQQATAWEARGFTVELFPMTQGLDTNSVHANIDGPSFVSTVTVWDSGEWDVTVGRMEAEHTESSDYHPAGSTAEVIAKIEEELNRMGIGAAPREGLPDGISEG